MPSPAQGHAKAANAPGGPAPSAAPGRGTPPRGPTGTQAASHGVIRAGRGPRGPRRGPWQRGWGWGWDWGWDWDRDLTRTRRPGTRTVPVTPVRDGRAKLEAASGFYHWHQEPLPTRLLLASTAG